MKKILIIILLGVFFIFMSSANAAQDLNNVIDAQQKTSGQDAETPGMIADRAAAAYADFLLTEKLIGEYEKAGKKEDAKKAREALLKKVTNNPGLYGPYAEFLNRTGDTSGAIAQLKKAQQLDPANTFYALRMAEILTASNQQDEAKAILTKLMNETKDNYIKEDAKRRLEQIDTLKNMPPAPQDGAVSTPMTQQPMPGGGGAYTPGTIQPAQQTAVPASAPVPPQQDTTKKN
ncbi:MAG: hypothetical protein AUJ70_03620 [Candidatus Omnitrophica bacterium CG1_02_40_15]|nr:MAG: hypothetical protein AUJ70_03620 [Candidatus Omnitrophica bacterium CG1_02_40_15]